jgi:DNA-binding MarR family transcriptional regulator
VAAKKIRSRTNRVAARDRSVLQPDAESSLGNDDYDVTKQVGHLLRKAYQTHIAIFQRLCADPQLTASQFAVLCAVRDVGPCPLTIIGRKVVMDPATTRGIVERLTERGLVSFARDKEDRRRVMVALRKEGKALLGKIVPSAKEITEVTVQMLNPAEKIALVYLLNKMSRQGEDDETNSHLQGRATRRGG